MTRNTSRPAALLVLLLSVAALLVVPLAAPASAAPAAPKAPVQTCSSVYGCPGTTTTTTAGALPLDPECVVSQLSGVIGANVDVTITNVPVGLRVNLILNGVTVDTAVSGEGDSQAASLGSGGAPKSAARLASVAAPAQTAAVADVNFSFRVPSGPAGSYSLFAVGDGFRCDCFPFAVIRQVEGDTIQNPGGSTTGGNLARTGFTVLGLLVLAAVLLVLGKAMVEASRRRGDGGTPAV